MPRCVYWPWCGDIAKAKKKRWVRTAHPSTSSLHVEFFNDSTIKKALMERFFFVGYAALRALAGVR